MKRILIWTVTAILTVAGAFSLASANRVADSLAYQARLTDNTGAGLPDGNYTLIFTFWTDSVGGSQVWLEDHVVTTKSGLFSTCLGCTTPLQNIFNGQQLWLQTQLSGSPPMTPRTRMLSVPYSLVSGSVNGDVKTDPGRVVVGDLDGDGSLDLHSTPDQSELHLARKRPGKVKYANITLRAMDDSISDYRDTDSDDDGIPESEYAQRLTPTTSSLSINTKGTGAKRLAAGGDCDDGDAILYTSTDDDGDGLAESSVTQSSSSDSADVSLKLKIDNTPVRLSTNFTVSKQSQGVDFGQRYDSDDDGIPESEAYIKTVPLSSSVAIKTKGTAADANRSMSITATTEGFTSAIHRSDFDDDGDGVPEQEISQTIIPGTSSVAIKTKGTGADKDRVISSTTDTSKAVTVHSADIDGDGVEDAVVSTSAGVAEVGGIPGGVIAARVAIKTKGTGADPNRVVLISGSTGTDNALHRCEIDDDGDGVPEQEISQGMTPVSSSLAIKTKGTGADANRSASIASTTAVGDIATVSAIDDDGDGLSDSDIEQHITPTRSSLAINSKGTSAKRVMAMADVDSACIAIDEPGVHISMRNKGWDGTIKGNLRITDGTNLKVDFDGDGDGYLSNTLGIGVLAPTHPIEHSSGAHLTAGGTWTNASDVNLKENFASIDGGELLEKIGRLPITRWNYKNEADENTHIGPTAQDFKAIFGVGGNDKTISTIDPSGIALAAIQELYKKSLELNNKAARISELESRVNQLQSLIEQMLQKQASQETIQ